MARVWKQRVASAFFGMVLGVVIPSLALGQATLMPNAKQQYLTDSAAPVASGSVTYYVPSTLTKKNVWTDAAKTTLSPNPVLLDAAGRPQPTGQTYGDGTYRQVVKDANNITIWDAITTSTGSSSSGSSTATGDGDLVGTIKPWAGLVAPNQYVFAYGQAISRTTYAALFTAIVQSQSVICTSGLNVLSGIADTTQIPIGGKVEATCIAPGTTVTAKSSTSVTVSANASVSTAVTARFFLYGNGDGSATFNVPDLRGRVLPGRDNMGGTAAGTLTSTYYGTDPAATGASGGTQSKSIALALANLPTGITSVNAAQNITTDGGAGSRIVIAGGAITNGLAASGSTTGPFPTNASGFGSSSQTIITSNSISVTSNNTSGTPYLVSVVQPSTTLNYIIKVTPDTNSSTASGVTSLGLMTGDIACGTGLTCTGNTATVTGLSYTPPFTGGVTETQASYNLQRISVLDFGALCNGSHDDTANFQAAIDALPQSLNGQTGGTILVPWTGNTYLSGGGCIITSTLNLNAKSNITIQGTGTEAINGSTSLIYYTGAGARFIDARDSSGIKIRGLTISYTNNAFAGILIDAGGNTPAVNPTSFGSASSYFELSNSRVFPVTSPGSATLLNVDQAIIFKIENNSFSGGSPIVRGAQVKQGSSTTGTFKGNTYVGHSGPAINGCGDTWTFIGDVFEGDNTTLPNGFGNTALTPCRNLVLINTWAGDALVPNGTFLSYLGSGINIIGGRYAFSATATVVKFLGATTGVIIDGPEIETGTFINFNGQSVAGVSVRGVTSTIGVATYTNTGSVIGFGFSEGNSPSSSRATTGQLLIGQSAADAAWQTLSGDATVNAAGVVTVVRPVPTRAGDITYWNGSAYVSLPGNNSGTQALVENASGVPSWATVAGTGTVTSVACGTGLTGGTFTTSGTCAVDYATKSDQQTGTATAKTVNSARQQDHDSAAKAWVTFTGSTGAILASYNVSGVTRLSAGSWTVTFTTAFASVNYVCHVNANGNPASVPMGASASKATGSMNAQTLNTSFVGADAPQVDVVCFGRQ